MQIRPCAKEITLSLQFLLIPRYIFGAMAPYIFLSLLMLTRGAVCATGRRLAELIIYTDLPISLLGEHRSSVVAGRAVFSIPLATLAGIIIGFSRMGSDSEIVAMRAAGVGSWTMIWPALLIGLVFTAPRHICT